MTIDATYGRQHHRDQYVFQLRRLVRRPAVFLLVLAVMLTPTVAFSQPYSAGMPTSTPEPLPAQESMLDGQEVMLDGGGKDGTDDSSRPSVRDDVLHLTLDGDSLTWNDFVAILEADEVSVSLSPEARLRMIDARAGALAALEHQRVYGWNQALGPLKDRPLTASQRREFQHRVLRSHAAGVGRALPADVTRLALVLRANAMARGRMGVRPALVDRMLELVNAGVTPRMPRIGPLGTGDLQPMAAAGLVLAGEPAAALFQGVEGLAPKILAKAGLEPEFTLDAGEAIALISGNSVLSARYIAAVRKASSLADAFEGAFTMLLEATRAEQGAFDGRTHRERGIPAENKAAARVRQLIAGSEWMTEKGRRRLGEEHPRIQDAVSVRAEPHILGTLRQTLAQARTDLLREANASTSNPLIFPRRDGHGYEFLMGGNWDGDLLGHSMDTLNAQITDLGILSETLSNRLLAEQWSYGLPPNLAGGKVGLNSGMVQVLTVATALVPEMQVRAHPAATLSRSVKFGQEDHNPMSAASMTNLDENLRRLEIILAVQAMMAAQGIDLIKKDMGGLTLGAGTERVHALIREHLSPMADDRHLTPDVRTMIRLIRADTVGAAVRSAVNQPAGS